VRALYTDADTFLEVVSWPWAGKHPEVLDHLVEFRTKWMWYLSRVYINEQTLMVRLRRTRSVPAIPASIAERLVPDMVKIVTELETLPGESGKPV